MGKEKKGYSNCDVNSVLKLDLVELSRCLNILGRHHRVAPKARDPVIPMRDAIFFQLSGITGSRRHSASKTRVKRAYGGGPVMTSVLGDRRAFASPEGLRPAGGSRRPGASKTRVNALLAAAGDDRGGIPGSLAY